LWPLRELEAAVAGWRDRTGRRPSIEWAMIGGVNDSDRQASLLATMARRLKAHVNLIPLNPTPGWPSQPSTPQRMAGFVWTLRDAGVNVTVRDTRGRDIDAACGQLRWQFESPSDVVAGSAHRHEDVGPGVAHLGNTPRMG
jgi:23S rRNA (adenine2503-C2)-methyltransferase